MPLEANAQFNQFVQFAQEQANPATSKAIARMGVEGPLGGRAIKAAAVAVAAVALASCAQVPGDAGANADAARGLRFGHWPTNSTESIEWRVLEERGHLRSTRQGLQVVLQGLQARLRPLKHR